MQMESHFQAGPWLGLDVGDPVQPGAGGQATRVLIPYYVTDPDGIPSIVGPLQGRRQGDDWQEREQQNLTLLPQVQEPDNFIQEAVDAWRCDLGSGSDPTGGLQQHEPDGFHSHVLSEVASHRDEPHDIRAGCMQALGEEHELEEVAQRNRSYFQAPGTSRKMSRKPKTGPPRERSSNWSMEETELLFTYKREVLLAMKQGRPGSKGTAAWNKIAEKIPGKTSKQCRLRWDTLKKAMKDIRNYCKEYGKEYAQLCEADFTDMQLATTFSPNWYAYIDEFHKPSRRKHKDDFQSSQSRAIHGTAPESSSRPIAPSSLESRDRCVELSTMAPEELHGPLRSAEGQLASSNIQSPQPNSTHGTTPESWSRPIAPSSLGSIRPLLSVEPPFMSSWFYRDLPSPAIMAPQESHVPDLRLPEGQYAIPGYAALPDLTKWILLDLILVPPKSFRKSETDGILVPPKRIWKSEINRIGQVKDVSRWLAVVHDMDAEEILYILQQLILKSIVRIWRKDEVLGGVHEHASLAPECWLEDLYLYRRYAQHEVQRNPQWVRSRVVIEWDHLQEFKAEFQHREINVLEIKECLDLRKVDLGAMTNLRSLSIEFSVHRVEVIGWEHLEKLGWLSYGEVIGWEDIEKLCWLSYKNVFLDTKHLTALQGLQLTFGNRQASTAFSSCQLVNLRLLTLRFCLGLEESPNLTNCRLLETLTIKHCPRIYQIHSSLSGLTALVHLELKGCRFLRRPLPDLSNLTNLRRLILRNSHIESIPGLEKLEQLRTLDCRGSEPMNCLPGLRHLALLETVDVRGTDVMVNGDVLCNHERVMLRLGPTSQWGYQKAIPGYDGLHHFTKCILLDLVLSYSLNHRSAKRVSRWLAIIHDKDSEDIIFILQQLNSKSILRIYDSIDDDIGFPDRRRQRYREFAQHEVESISQHRLAKVFDDFLIEFEVEGLQYHRIKLLDFYNCPALTKVNLGALTNLRSLGMIHCDKVREVNGWENLKKLGWLEWRGPCKSFFHNTKYLTALQYLDLNWCRDVPVSSPPDLSHCVHLRSLSLSSLRETFMETPDFTNLKLLQDLRIKDCPKICTIHPSLSELTALVHLDLSILSNLMVPNLGNLVKLQSLDLSETSISSIPGVKELENLVTLICVGTNVECVPGLEMCGQLRKLVCYDSQLKWLPDLRHLSFLEEIDVSNTHIVDKASVLCNHGLVKVFV